MKNLKQTITFSFALFKNDLKKQNIESKFGFFWDLIQPLIYCTFYLGIKVNFTFSALDIDQSINLKIANIFIGIFLIQLWIKMITVYMGIIKSNFDLLKLKSVNLFELILSNLFALIIQFLFRFSIILILCLFFNIFEFHLYQFVLFIASLFLYIGSALVIGLLFAPFTFFYKDFRLAISAVTLPLLLISPVFYFPITNGLFYKLSFLNPINAFLPHISNFFTNAGDYSSYYLAHYCIWFFIFTLISIMIMRSMHKNIDIIIQRSGS